MDRTELASQMWFQKINFFGNKTLFRLKEHFGSMREAYQAEEKELMMLLSSRQYTAFKAARHAVTPRSYMQQISQMGIRYVSFDDEIYPEKLHNIPDPPFGLFVKGSLPDEGKPSVAMIGARACSEYGKMVAREFAAQLAGYNVQIISGMARGIDSISQESCLKEGGRTFAVLGCGVDICYPGELQQLYRGIADSGGLISTYPPGFPPVSGCFPPRNRIISGLSDVVVVIEARRKSGTLITVDMALEQGKEVAVIPGRITDSLSQGCHDLISQGASVITDVEQLLELIWDAYKLQPYFQKSMMPEYKSFQKSIELKKGEGLDGAQRSIYEILRKEPQEPEVLFQKWKEGGAAGSFRELMEGLMELELMDLCKSNKNRFFIG